MRRAAALIVGGGPAGAAAGILLAGHGRDALILERDRTPADHLCGGFLSWTTLAALDRLGIDAAALGAPMLDAMAIFAGHRRARAPLPRPCRSLSRRALDRALLNRAAAAGCGIERGVAVRSLDGDSARLSDGARLGAGALILATGKRDLRGLPRVDRPEGDPVLGLRWRLLATAGLRRLLAGAVELHLVRDGYAGLALQEDGTANLCMAIRRSRLTALGGDTDRLLAALGMECAGLGERLDAAGGLTGPVQAVANVPYGWTARAGGRHAPYRVGDQAAVIPSLAGEGLSIALGTGMAAADALHGGRDAARFQSALRRRTRPPVRRAGALRHVAEAPLGASALVALLDRAPGLGGWAARLLRL